MDNFLLILFQQMKQVLKIFLTKWSNKYLFNLKIYLENNFSLKFKSVKAKFPIITKIVLLNILLKSTKLTNKLSVHNNVNKLQKHQFGIIREYILSNVLMTQSKTTSKNLISFSKCLDIKNYKSLNKLFWKKYQPSQKQFQINRLPRNKLVKTLLVVQQTLVFLLWLY